MTTGDRISELPAADEAIAGNDLIAVTNVSKPGTGKTEKRAQDELLASQLNLNFRTATELTISGGEITVTQSNHKLQPESGTTDDLDTISGTTAGKILVLYVSDAGTDTITIKHGTGNISCLGASDVDLSQGSAIFYSDGTTVYLIGGGGGGGSAPATTAENDFQVGNGSGSWIKKTLAETKTILAVLESLVGDTTPQLGGDLDMNDHGISVNVEPTNDLDYQGIVTTMTVDTNAEGVGAPLFLAADGHLDTADADTVATAPCVALALETGTGSKKVLLMGTLRVDAWNWTIGPGATSLIYLSETVGTLTQTKPTTEDAVVQPVGFALTDDMIMFNPSMIFITHGA